MAMRREVPDGVFVCPLYHLEGGFGPGQRFAAGDELLNIVNLVFRGAFRDCWPQVNLRLASVRGLVPCRFPGHPPIALSAVPLEASGSYRWVDDWAALMHVLSLTWKFPRPTRPFPSRSWCCSLRSTLRPSRTGPRCGTQVISTSSGASISRRCSPAQRLT